MKEYQRELINKLYDDHIRDAIIYGTSTGRLGGRASGKSVLANWPLQNSFGQPDVRLAGTSEFAIPAGLYTSEFGAQMMIHDGQLPPAPTSTVQDREYLQLSVQEYRTFAENVHHAYINRDGQVCSLRQAKLKKLKNLRYKINKSPFLKQSMVWRAQLQSIETEIARRQHDYRRSL